MKERCSSGLSHDSERRSGSKNYRRANGHFTNHTAPFAGEFCRSGRSKSPWRRRWPPVVWFCAAHRGLRSGSGDEACWLATSTDAGAMQLTAYYARRSAIECGFRRSTGLRAGPCPLTGEAIRTPGDVNVVPRKKRGGQPNSAFGGDSLGREERSRRQRGSEQWQFCSGQQRPLCQQSTFLRPAHHNHRQVELCDG